jgi:hypothetical protein
MDKIKQTEKGITKGDVKPTDAQLEMVGSKAALQEEIKELQELCDLYLRANPECLNKKLTFDEEEVKVNPEQQLTDALDIIIKMFQL